MRVHALAKLLGVTSKAVAAALDKLGAPVRSAQSSINRDVAEQVRAELNPGADVAAAPVAEPAPAAPAQAEPAQPEPAVAETRAPVRPVAAPLFIQPEVVKAPPRRRASRPAAPAVPQDVPEEVEEAAAAAVTEATTDAPAVTGGDEDDDAPKRRRRGRRGRGRGRGPQGEDSYDDNDGDDSGHDGDDTAEAQAETSAPEPQAVEPEVAEEESESSGGGRSRGGRSRGGRSRGGRAAADKTDVDPASETSSDEQSTGDADKIETGADDADTSSDDQGADDQGTDADNDSGSEDGTGSRRRRRRRRKSGGQGGDASGEDSGDNREDDPPNTVVHEREPRSRGKSRQGREASSDQVQGITGSTRLEAKRQRRRDGRDAGRRRPAILTESEFLARREAVNRKMVVRERGKQTQVAVLEDDILVEHFVTSASSSAMVGNIYLGRVQNVLPSMEAAFIDVGRGRNGVLYAGEVDWDAAGLGGKSRKIEQALHSGDNVVVQVSKDPVGHKGARLTTQISLPGRFLVYVPGGGSTGISRKLPDTERKRLKEILKRIVPAEAGVIIRTAAEGVSEEELTTDVERLRAQWDAINTKATAAMEAKSTNPVALYEEPDLLLKVVRDQFNEDFSKLVVAGDSVWDVVEGYVNEVAPDLAERVERYSGDVDVFTAYRIDEQLAKAMDRKVWLPSGGTLVIDRTEAMTVVDVNTGKFTGAGGNLEETVTRNNLEAAEEIVRQMRLRDIGGMIVVDFIDMVLESNRDLVLRRLTECLGRDRTRHQVSEVTSLGLVQMTRKRMGAGLIEEFSTPCEHCHGRGVIVQDEPVVAHESEHVHGDSGRRSRRGKGGDNQPSQPKQQPPAPKPAVVPTVKEPWPAALIPASSAKAQTATAQSTAPQPEPAEVAAAEPVAVEQSAAAAAVAPQPESTEQVESTEQAGSSQAQQTAAEPAQAESSQAEPAVIEHPQAEQAEVKAPARRSRSRRASRPTAAPAAVDLEPVVVASEAAPAPAVEPSTTTAEPVAAEVAEATQAVEQVEQADRNGVEPAPVASPPRRSRARRASRPTAAPEALSTPVEPIVVPAAAPAEPAPAASAPAPSEAEPGEAGGSAAAATAVAAPAAATRPRRRRAAARPAGPPVEEQ
ncbi:translation initiation factor IF-2 N-terminal domain-containing protein [Rhodococcus sp. X156]|uniref:translation initiation factor IF-2 N-terminal domain-containing protein n=1 Tax=Rhodococcus sp. X156 TaxID=2499145 RepID=UPI000FDABAB2|nr:translation initiation factor IF-2 N-terminal domain-containing protein [Rhodococcus sp. X156]